MIVQHDAFLRLHNMPVPQSGWTVEHDVTITLCQQSQSKVKPEFGRLPAAAVPKLRHCLVDQQQITFHPIAINAPSTHQACHVVAAAVPCVIPSADDASYACHHGTKNHHGRDRVCCSTAGSKSTHMLPSRPQNHSCLHAVMQTSIHTTMPCNAGCASGIKFLVHTAGTAGAAKADAPESLLCAACIRVVVLSMKQWGMLLCSAVSTPLGSAKSRARRLRSLLSTEAKCLTGASTQQPSNTNLDRHSVWRSSSGVC